MADATISIGLDLESLMNDAKRAALQVKQEFERNKPKLSIDLGKATAEIARLSDQYKELVQTNNRTSYEIKQAMAQLIVSGQKGTEEYKKLEEELKRVTAEATKLDDAFKEVEESVKETGEKASQGFASRFSQGIKGGISEISSIFSSGLSGLTAGLGKFGVYGAVAAGVVEGVQAIGNALKSLYEQGAKIDEMNDMLTRSFMQAGISAQDSSKFVEQANKTATQLAFQYGESKSKLKEYIGLAASLGGVVGEQNTQLT
ncbi:MAG: hypothetical protein N2560_08730, partial [Ignavibacteria bacterium]|nr:hypothetical protein [Ignavibacteria bacterium]